MARSVVLQPTPRCERCSLPPRWCVCAGLRTIESPLQVDVLMHPRELWRPSSTGHLVTRTMAGARRHLWDRDELLPVETVRVPERELWILHPNGEPLPAGADPAKVQVLLVDGSWRESLGMARAVAGWGRPVALPMTGESRYWLRTQQEGGRFSTVEALLFLLAAFGLAEAHAELALQLELHVYAGLRARGFKEMAEDFLKTSPLPAARPQLIEQLNVRRSR